MDKEELERLVKNYDYSLVIILHLEDKVKKLEEEIDDIFKYNSNIMGPNDYGPDESDLEMERLDREEYDEEPSKEFVQEMRAQ